MKKLYAYLLTLMLTIPSIIHAMDEEKKTPPQKKWWNTQTWNKKVAYSAAGVLAAALAIFGTYAAMIARAKSNIKWDLDKAAAGRKVLQNLANKAHLATYQYATPKEQDEIINRIVAKMPLSDIAFSAMFGNFLP